MPIIEFPDPTTATEEGIVAYGGDLHPESLRLAYREGIFPWPLSSKVQGIPIAWFCPEERAILEFKDIHIPRSLAKLGRKNPYHFTIDRDFPAVVAACAAIPRPGQDDTWITEEMLGAYCELHRWGYAHSVEAWEGNDLVGGLYGVEIDGAAFAGESMFHLRDGASKLALLHLVEHLKSKGVTWMDIQVMTPHLEHLGAKTLSRNAFLRKLKLCLSLNPGGKRLFAP